MKKKYINNKSSVYIPSIEASDIWEHEHRQRKLFPKFIGMIPYSLKLIKLREYGLEEISSKRKDKNYSTDIINVEFNKSVYDFDTILKRINKKIEKNKKELKEMSKEQKIKEKKQLIEQLEQNKNNFIENNSMNENFQIGFKRDELRYELYTKGFVVEFVSEKKNIKIITTKKYEFFERSGSKSRTGKVLFICNYKKEIQIDINTGEVIEDNEQYRDIAHKIKLWSNMYIDLADKECDVSSILPYQTLTSSGLIDCMKIDTKNIFVIDDINSVFNFSIKNVHYNENREIVSTYEPDGKVKNSLFDGQSLGDISLFESGGYKDKGFLLLRNHYFKSAMFNANIQDFLKDNCPDGVEFNDWKLQDMFGNSIFAKDILLITTPNSMKFLKFYDFTPIKKKKKQKKDIYEYWKKIVKKDKNIFGIVKYEKQSKKNNIDGKIANQMSYQMINSIPFNRNEISELCKNEKKYISQLKNNDDVFLKYLKDNENPMNSYKTVYEMSKLNKDFLKVDFVKKLRSNIVTSYKNHISKGKPRVVGDYCVMVGNPIEMLYATIGKFKEGDDSYTFTGNEMYTPLLDVDREYVAIRNPHTAVSNLYVFKNKHYDDFKYINFTNNIIAVNSIKIPSQDVLSGCDFDSDTVMVMDSEVLLKRVKECFLKYPVPVNNIPADKRKYTYNTESFCEIDNVLATSQMMIGRCVNDGQIANSCYWDLLNNESIPLENKKETLNRIMSIIDIETVFSGIAIDSAKRAFDIDIGKEISIQSDKLKEFMKQKEIDGKIKTYKPNFFKFVSLNDNIIDQIKPYKTSMDYLIDIMNNIKQKEDRSLTFNLVDLFHNCESDDKRSGNDLKKARKLSSLLKEVKSELFKINNQRDVEVSLRYSMSRNLLCELKNKVSRNKVNNFIIYSLIEECDLEIFNILYSIFEENIKKIAKKRHF